MHSLSFYEQEVIFFINKKDVLINEQLTQIYARQRESLHAPFADY